MSIFTIALVACASASGDGPNPTFGTQSFASGPSDAGLVEVTMYSSPDPIARVSSLEIVVKDARSGAPVDGLDVSIVPWMPAMGHGASTVPTVTAKGGGVYVATNLVLFMPGEWQLRTSVAGTVSDTFTATVDVP